MLTKFRHSTQAKESGPIHSVPLSKFKILPQVGHLIFRLAVDERNARVIDVKLGLLLSSLSS